MKTSKEKRKRPQRRAEAFSCSACKHVWFSRLPGGVGPLDCPACRRRRTVQKARVKA